MICRKVTNKASPSIRLQHLGEPCEVPAANLCPGGLCWVFDRPTIAWKLKAASGVVPQDDFYHFPIRKCSTAGHRSQAPASIRPPAENPSSQVSVHIWVVFIPLQVIPCDKILNSLLYCLEVRLKHASKLLHTFHHKLLMTQYFATLHNTHNWCINCVSAILINIFNYFLLLINWRKRYL